MKARILFFLLPGGVAAGFAALLIDAGVKSGMLLLLAAGAAVALRRSAAATRHVVWTAAMICALLMPILSLCLPQWRVLPDWMGPEAATLDQRSLTTVPPRMSTSSEIEVAQLSGDRAATPAVGSDAASSNTFPREVSGSASKPAIAPVLSRNAALLLGWAMGAAFLLLSLLRSAWSLRRLSRRSQIITDGVVAETAKKAAAELQVSRRITIHAGGDDAMPMVWGIWRARLLLPSSAAQWTQARLRAVMLHELAHIRRRDPLTLLLAQLARAVHWFNPLAWLAVARLRAEQERACDDCVLRAGVKPSDYATDVLEIATALRAAPATAGMALSMAAPARLERRLRVIVETAANRAALTGWVVAGIAVVAIAVALPLAMVRAAEDQQEANTSKARNIGPVIEVPLTKVENSNEEFLDLDTGRRVSRSAALAGSLREWARGEKMDLAAHDWGGDGKNHIRTFDLLVAAVPASCWENSTVQEILAERLTQYEHREKAWAEDGTYLRPEQDQTNTYIFQTRENSRGVLQIVGSSKDPDGVKLRYRLVQAESFNRPRAERKGTKHSADESESVFDREWRAALSSRDVPIRGKVVRPRRGFEPVGMTILFSSGERRFFSLEDGRVDARKTDRPVAYLERDAQAGWSLVIENIYNYRADRKNGAALEDLTSAEQLAEPAGLAAVPFERKGVYALRQTELPLTILIPEWGLLRVAEIDFRNPDQPFAILHHRPLAAHPPSSAKAGADRRRAVPESDLRESRDQADQRASPGTAREVVDEWLGHVAAERIDQMWSLTTRESGMDTGIRKLAAFGSIRAKHLLGSDTAAMVVSTRFKDDAARPRALLFLLVRQNDRWLIREMIMDTPENIQRRVEGFAAYPGVKFHVEPEEIVGEWRSGFLISSQHTFKPDGSGETVKADDEAAPDAFRWGVHGDLLTLHSGGKVMEGRIVRMEDDLFAVRYGDNNQWGYHRVAASTAVP